MSDDRLFDIFRTLDRPLEPRADFSGRLLETLLAEAGLAPSPGLRRWSRLWRIGPARLEVPLSGWRFALLVLALVALLSVTIALIGAALLQMQKGFVEAPVNVIDVGTPGGWSLDILASEGDIGDQPALGYDTGATPVVAYFDRGAGSLLVARCDDTACSSLGPSVDAGPVVTDIAFTFGYLAVEPAGDAWIVRTIPAVGGEPERVVIQRVCPEPAGACEPTGPTDLGPGLRPMVRVRADGRPVVLFGSPSLLVVCGDAACRDGNRTTTVPVSPVERDFVLAKSGVPIFATSSGEAVDLVTCLDESCERVATARLGPGRQPRVALDSLGRPLVAAFAGRSVVLYRCTDIACSAGTWSSLADVGPPPSGGDEMLSLDLRVAPGDRPYVSVSVGGELRLVGCSTSACDEATRVTLDETSPAWAASHALGLDTAGLPFIVYGVRSDLKVARCLGATCMTTSAEPSPSVLPTGGASPTAASTTLVGLIRTVIDRSEGANPAVTVGPDGLPVAVYARGDTTAVVVLHCGDPRCATGNTLATIPYMDAWAGAVTIGPSGWPVVVAARSSGTISVIRCADAACNVGQWIFPTVTGSMDGVFVDFAAVAVIVPGDDRPLVAYQNGEIWLGRCVDPSCSAWVQAALDTKIGGAIANSIELRIGADGAPIVGYALTNGETRIAHCSDLDCSRVTVTVAGTKGNDKTTAALGVGPDGIPVLAFYSDGSLVVARCRDQTCTAVTTTRVDDATAGWWTPIGVGFDQSGSPIIVYWSPDNRHKKLALCKDAACAAAELIAVEASDANGADDQTGVTLLPDGSPVYVYVRNGAVYSEVCTDPRCGG